jgi:hypothetical protein
LFRSILSVWGIVLGFLLLGSCASTRPEDVPVPAPILSKTVWDDVSGRAAPADSIGRNLVKMLSRRNDMVVSEEGKPKGFPARSPGEGGPPRKGPRPGGGAGGMPGAGEYGSRVSGGAPDAEPRVSSLHLLMAGTVERWDLDSERTALDASVGSDPPVASGARSPVKLSVRLVSKATGRVVWKKTEECVPAASSAAADGMGSSPSGWAVDFERCDQEVLRSTVRDVAAAVLDLARQTAISEASSSPGR